MSEFLLELQPGEESLDLQLSVSDARFSAELDAVVITSPVTIRVGTTVEGDTPEVSNSGTNTDAILDFVLPRGPAGYTPRRGVDYWTPDDQQAIVSKVLEEIPPPDPYKIGPGLKVDAATNTLSVNTADSVEEDNTLPITSAAVYTTVGNIEILLGTI